MKNQNWLTLWNDAGVRPLTDLRREVDRLFDDFWTGDSPNRTRMAEASFVPACDVEEGKDHFLLSVEMPGISKDDIKIELMENQVTVSGERKNERSGREGNAWYSERRYGKFHRTFTLPAGVAADKMEAQYQDGVLKLLVPKAESAKPKQVKISEGNQTGFFGKFLGSSKSEPKSPGSEQVA